MALDRYGRRIHYLRISLTDHCNLRCLYCMPEDMVFRPSAELLQDDEILRLMAVFVRLGFDKFRLTGGEPTVRAGMVDLVGAMRRIPGVEQLSMTSNGILVAKHAAALKAAGLDRINFSLDTLDPDRYHALTRYGSLSQVWEGIAAAERVGLTPIKLNAVVVRQYNVQDVAPLAALTLTHPWQVRFIEMMPFAGATEFQQSQVVRAAEMQAAIAAELGPLEPLHGGALDGEAQLFKLKDAQGDLGFIASVSQPFCDRCTRARLTADGRLRLCLLRDGEVDLLTPLRAGATDAELRELILGGVWVKPWGHGLGQGDVPLSRTMSEIGG
jgi:cyclic pyranopterin phosphate synthase